MSNKGVALPIVIAVIAVLVLGGAYLAVKNRALAPATEPAPTQPPAPSDPTANWQTYRNEEYGFEFRYPAEWRLEVPCSTKGGLVESCLSLSDGGVKLNIVIHPTSDLENSGWFSAANVQKTQISSGGLNWTALRTAVVRGYGTAYGNSIFTVRNVKTFNIAVATWEVNQLDNLQFWQNQILATFRFLE